MSMPGGAPGSASQVRVGSGTFPLSASSRPEYCLSMAEDQLWDVIATSHLGTVATIKRDGRPQLSDVSYLAEADRLIRFSTRTSLAKVHNLRRDPRISIK